MTKTIITFARNWRGYAAGETAGFDETTARALIDANYAEEVEKKGKRSSRPPAKPPETKPEAPPAKPEVVIEDEKP